MKPILQFFNLKITAFIMLLTLISVQTIAQDSTTSTTTVNNTQTTATQTMWYMQPWAWVAGGIVLLLILVSLFRGNSSRSEKVIVTRTVTRDPE